MASTNKTEHLKLNSWLETDRPKRIDFQNDNNILDDVVGTHVNNGNMHLTSEEKQRVASPFNAVGYSGTGESSKTISVGFNPSMVFVFKKSSPMLSYNSSGYMIHNSGLCVSGGIGNTGGVSISNSNVTVTQSSSQSGDSFFNLNENGGQYAILAFR